nr:hypothetical protein [Tanacetum cinerariifolium]
MGNLEAVFTKDVTGVFKNEHELVIELTVTLVCVIMEGKIPTPNTPQPWWRKAQRFDKEEAAATLPQRPSNTRSFGGYQSKADKDDNCTVSKQRIGQLANPYANARPTHKRLILDTCSALDIDGGYYLGVPPYRPYKADDDENWTVSKQRIATTYKPALMQRE